MALAFFTSAVSKIGARSCSSWSAGLRRTAVRQSMSFSFTMSMENLSAAAAVRLPLRVWSMNSLPSWMVNSMSWTSLKCFSRVARTFRSSA
jgi:hypothetical protein